MAETGRSDSRKQTDPGPRPRLNPWARPRPRPAATAARAELWALVEILALSGLVITQPVLDVTGRSPDFFLFHGAGPGEILLLVAVYATVPPVLLWGAGAAVGLLLRPARQLVHLATVAVLTAAFAVLVGKHLLPARGPALLLPAVALGAAGAYAYRRWTAPGRLLRVAAVGPVIFVLIFLLASPTSAVVLPGRSGPAVGSGSAAGQPPVVLLVLDELPLVSLLGADGRIDAQRFPNFARLADGSTWYRNATGVSGWTPYALPAMLTGRYPTVEQAPHYSRYPDNLFTAFSRTHQIRARESIARLCPPEICPDRGDDARGGLPALFAESATVLAELLAPVDARQREPEEAYRERTRREAAGRDGTGTPTDPRFRWGALDQNQPARFVDFLTDLRPADRPAVHFLHLLLPHSPWNYLPSGVRYPAPDGMPNDGDGWVALAHQRHIAQLQYTDRLLGETLRRLRETGLYDDALVAVTADHGVSFTRGFQGRGIEAIDRAPAEVLWVPMFIKRPGQRDGLVDDRNWEHVDLLPTLADLAGVPIRGGVDGRSAVREARPGGDKHFYDKPGELRMVPNEPIFAQVVGGTAGPVLPPDPLPELVGHAVAGLPTGSPAGRATVANRAEFAEVEPASGQLPALVWGTAPAAVPTGARIAVAVNGRVAAVTRVVAPDPGGHRFAALVPDGTGFVPGPNRIDLYLVADSGELRPLRD